MMIKHPALSTYCSVFVGGNDESSDRARNLSLRSHSLLTLTFTHTLSPSSPPPSPPALNKRQALGERPEVKGDNQGHWGRGRRLVFRLGPFPKVTVLINSYRCTRKWDEEKLD